jgi:transposase InsO family protein
VEEVFTRHGAVEKIRSDQGLEFTNKLVRLVSKLWESRFRHSSPYHPQTNGLAERTNQTIINKISKAMEDYKINWDRVLPYVLMQYRV